MPSRAQIVATVGPASKSKSILKEMVKHQMDVMRLNFSWGTYDEHAHYIKMLREVANEANRSIPIIQDLSGPRQQTDEGHGYDEQFEESDMGVLTEKDIKDLDFGLNQNIEYVALSYVGQAHDVEVLKQEILKRSNEAKVIAKIEREIALGNYDEILEVADAIMVARGDLGHAIPIEQLPFVEKELVEKANKAKKPIIIATQMLLSMCENSEPTRAEVVDVAYAIMLGSDAVMLSDETAQGKHPIESVATMEKIILEAEKHFPDNEFHSL
jgi:pyruvate kinase